MLVKCVKDYQDTELKRLVEVNEVYEVSKERAEKLFKAKVAEKAPTPEVVVETADKKPVVTKKAKKKEA